VNDFKDDYTCLLLITNSIPAIGQLPLIIFLWYEKASHEYPVGTRGISV